MSARDKSLIFKMILQAVIFTLTLLSFTTADTKSKCMSDPVTKIINTLGSRLEQRIDNQNNYFFSPLSISVSLAMVYVGAKGTTRDQMAEVLEYNIVGRNCLPNKISQSFGDLFRSLRKESEDYSFLIANGAFIQSGYHISHSYSSNLGRFFNTHVQFLNFAEEEGVAMMKINEWVANYTKGKIEKLLNEPLDKLTVMVLLNAVYFKGLWDLPFNETLTRNGQFYRYNEPVKDVPFMILHDQAFHYYDEEQKHDVLELEYLGGNISMILILPKKIRQYPDFKLKDNFFCEMREKFTFKTLTIMLPKFKMEFKRELSKDMINIGMSELFSDRADLTGIREANDLHVSLMVHKAVIEVNEQGSEASGTTGLGIDGRRKEEERNEAFLADHPFLFYIIHRETNTILFSGRVMDP